MTARRCAVCPALLLLAALLLGWWLVNGGSFEPQGMRCERIASDGALARLDAAVGGSSYAPPTPSELEWEAEHCFHGRAR